MEDKILSTSPIKEFDIKSVRTIREPKCGRCRNHDQVSRIKGHQGQCLYAQCMCSKCNALDKRRRVNRQKLRLRREEDSDFRRLLQASNRSPSLDHQPNLSTNIVNEPNAMWSRMNWPMNLSFSPQANVNLPHPCNLNSGTSMVSESPCGNIYSPNKLADFFPPYAHSSPSYLPTAAHVQNVSYKPYNSDPSNMYGRSCFNPVSYNRPPVTQQISNNRFGISQGSHYMFNWPSKQTTYIPTDFAEDCSIEGCSLVNDTKK